MNTFLTLLSLLAVFIGGLIVAIPAIMNYKGWISISKQQEEFQQSFDNVVEKLSSDKMTAQLSAAVLLRRFFKVKFNYHFLIRKRNINENDSYFLKKDTLDVIASLLKTLPTGVYQKTLADGLSSCQDLSHADLQYANLQNVYLGNDSYIINMSKADLFCANLSKALIKNINASGCYFRDTILCDTRFKHCDLSNTNFQGADLTHVYFQNVTLDGAIFNNALNIPKEIVENINNNTGIYKGKEPVTTSERQSTYHIFFSMSGSLSYEDKHLIKMYEEHLKKRGYEVESYSRDHYPQFGQLTSVKAKIEKCVGMIVFGSKQILIQNGIFRPNLSEQTIWKDKWLSTSWNEIEVGMGIVLGIPILLVKTDELKTGIFDPCLNEILLDKALARTDHEDPEKDENFINWLSKLPQQKCTAAIHENFDKAYEIPKHTTNNIVSNNKG